MTPDQLDNLERRSKDDHLAKMIVGSEVRALVARCRELEEHYTALTERLRLAEAVCEAADSVSSEPDVSDLHSCYNMGVELGQRLAAWRKVKIEP